MLSVVITTHHEDPTCYLTAFAIKAQLEAARLEHEVIIVADGGTELKWENQKVRCLRGTFGSPQASRDAGIRRAHYPDVLVLESHVIVSDAIALLLEHQRLGATITFPIRVAEGPEMFTVYAHRTDWDKTLWHKNLVYEPVSKTPHRTSQFGQSCFVINRDWYVLSGGYTDILRGWGGEEPFLCLKCWLLGGTLWQVPTVKHWHWLTAGAHAGFPDLANNLSVVGYLLAGRTPTNVTITDAMRSERDRICAGPFGGDVNKLREFFKREGVIN